MMASDGRLTTTRLGTTGLRISRVGLGSWAIGGPWQWGWGRQDDRTSIDTILRAIELGVNWIDTAAAYGFGHSEEIVGNALRRVPAERRPLVFTKCGIERNQQGDDIEAVGEPEVLRRGTEASIRRLGVEAIDLMQLHWPPGDVALEEAWSTLVDLRDEGKVRFAGLSNCSVAQLELAESIGHVDTLQPQLSLIERAARRGPLPWCERHGTGTIVYSPMGGGRLTGRLDQAAVDRLDEDDWRRKDENFNGDSLARTLALVERLRRVGDELGCSLPELAVAWTLHQTGVDGAIVGARRPDQIDGWIRAGEIRLPPEIIDGIEHAIAETGAGAE
jgi:aryl-alcohol dehydrogenase-like predicted oxidoreductase